MKYLSIRKLHYITQRKKHNEIRGNEIIFLKRALDDSEESIKEYQKYLNNTTAVIAVNDYLKMSRMLKAPIG